MNTDEYWTPLLKLLGQDVCNSSWEPHGVQDVFLWQVSAPPMGPILNTVEHSYLILTP